MFFSKESWLNSNWIMPLTLCVAFLLRISKITLLDSLISVLYFGELSKEALRWLTTFRTSLMISSAQLINLWRLPLARRLERITSSAIITVMVIVTAHLGQMSTIPPLRMELFLLTTFVLLKSVLMMFLTSTALCRHFSNKFGYWLIFSYYEGGVSSVYTWDTDEGFAAVILIKKSGFLRQLFQCFWPCRLWSWKKEHSWRCLGLNSCSWRHWLWYQGNLQAHFYHHALDGRY